MQQLETISKLYYQLDHLIDEYFLPCNQTNTIKYIEKSNRETLRHVWKAYACKTA